MATEQDTTPRAALTNESASDPTTTFGRSSVPHASGHDAGELAAVALILCGLRHDDDAIRRAERMIEDLLQDSRTYQLWLKRGEDRGRTEEARRLLTRLGTRRFGAPPAAVEAALAAVTDREWLDRMFDAADTAAGWDDLLSTP